MVTGNIIIPNLPFTLRGAQRIENIFSRKFPFKGWEADLPPLHLVEKPECFNFVLKS